MVERAAHFLGRGVARLVGDLVPFAIVVGDLGVINRQILVAASEILNRETALLHHRAKQPVAAQHRFLRAIDEQGLGFVPFAGEAVAFLVGERADMKPGNALLALRQIAFGIAASADPVDGAVVFVAEAIAQLVGLAPAQQEPDQRQSDDDRRQNDQECGGLVTLHRNSPHGPRRASCVPDLQG